MAPIWTINEDGAKLNPDVRKGLLQIAQDFVKELKTNHGIDIKITDIVIIGSLTNYNWTPYSDVDLHIVTDFSALNMDKDDAQTMFDAIKTAWNNKHDIKMKGHDVELYVQDKEHVPTSASEYSVAKDKWLKEPVKESPSFNKELIKRKYDEYKKKIEELIKQSDDVALKALLDKLYKFRQAGLDKRGELSEENIVFKALRAHGYLDRLKENIDKIYDKKVSVKESSLIDDGIKIDDENNITVVPDNASQPLDSVVPTAKFHPQNHTWHTFKGVPIYSAYSISKKLVTQLKTQVFSPKYKNEIITYLKDLVQAIKHPKDESSKQEVDKLVKESIDMFMFVAQRQIKADLDETTIIIPIASKSKLNFVIAQQLQEKIPGSKVLSEHIIKKKWKDVKLSASYEREKASGGDGETKIGPDLAAKHLAMMQAKSPDEDFEVKKTQRRGLRRYFSHFLGSPEDKNEELTRLLKDAKIVLIDDTLDEGATFEEAVRLVKAFQPHFIVGYIFLWRK